MSQSHRSTCVAALIIGLLPLLFVPSTRAQTSKATLSGIVSRADGASLSGITVELVSRRVRLNQTTDIGGHFLFPFLPAGVYDVFFRTPLTSLPGHLRLILAESGQYRVTAELGTDDKAGWTVRQDRFHTGFPSTQIYTREIIQRLPSPPNLWRLVGFTEVSATAERFDISGMHSDDSMLFGSRGDSWSQNTVRANGLSLNSVDGTRPLISPDLSAVEAITYAAAGTTGAGAALSLQPRSGESGFHGQAHLSFQSGALQNTNVTPRLQSFGITESDERFRHFVQGSAQAGGPLGSNFNYFISFGRLQIEKWIRNHPLPVNSFLTSGTFHLTGDVSGRDRIGLLWMGQQGHQPQEGSSPQIVREAARNTTRRFQAFQAWWTRSISPSSLLDARASFSGGTQDAGMQPETVRLSRLDLFPSSVDIEQVPSAESGRSLVAMWNRVQTGAAPLFTADRDRSMQASLQFHNFRRGPGKSGHGISAGIAARDVHAANRSFSLENLQQRFFRGIPDSVRLVSPADTHNHGTFIRADALDDISLGAFHFNLAAQIDWERGGNRQTTGESGNDLRWLSFSGHAGVAYKFGRAHPTVIRASLAQRRHDSLIRALNAVHPDGLGFSTHIWNDISHDGSFQPEELGLLLKHSGPRYSHLDPSVQQPRTKEISIQATQILPWNLGFSALVYRRVEHQLPGFINTGVPLSAYTPSTAFDPGNDGASRTGDEASITVYNQKAETLGMDSYFLTNPSDAGGFSEGYEARLTYQGKRSQWELSFTRYRAVGRTAPGNGVRENDGGVFAVFNNPNEAINAYGSTFFDRGLSARFWGSSMPGRRTTISWIVCYLDGAPYGRILPVTGLNQGLIGVLATRRGPGDGSPNNGKRTAYNLTADVRLSRDFSLRHGRLIAMLDVFNLLNMAKATSEADVTSPTHLWRIPLNFQTPRSLQLGLRFDW